MQNTMTKQAGREAEAQGAPALSNYASDLAERAGAAYRRGGALSLEAAAAYLEAGRLLRELKTECGHGRWTGALRRAGIPPTTARRMMRIARAGMTAESVVEAGGVKAADAGLAARGALKTATGAGLGAAAANGANGANGAFAGVPGRAADTGGARMTDAARSQARRARLREAGLCVACGVAPAHGRSRCSVCADHQRTQAAARAARARIGAAVEPRLRAALEAGHGARLTFEEVKAAFAASPARARRSP